MSYVYLIHFSKPIGNINKTCGTAQHYLGYTSLSLKKRFEQHINGSGSRICWAAKYLYNAELTLVRYWVNGTRYLEAQLKSRKKASKLCPICNSNIKERHSYQLKSLEQKKEESVILLNEYEKIKNAIQSKNLLVVTKGLRDAVTYGEEGKELITQHFIHADHSQFFIDMVNAGYFPRLSEYDKVVVSCSRKNELEYIINNTSIKVAWEFLNEKKFFVYPATSL